MIISSHFTHFTHDLEFVGSLNYPENQSKFNTTAFIRQHHITYKLPFMETKVEGVSSASLEL